jgi:hypothetical protein
MWMIGLTANSGPFFVRVNPNAAVFTPHFNKICDWNSGFFYFQSVPPSLISAPLLPPSVLEWFIAAGNEEGLAGFAVRDSNTTTLAAVYS